MHDGGLVSIYATDATDTSWRFIDFKNGATHHLYQRDSTTFTSSDGWNGSTPAVNTYTFSADAHGRANALSVSRVGSRVRRGRRVPVIEDTATFFSGNVKLFGKLVRPAEGKGPWPVVVFVHGSDNAPSVDRMWDPYLLAANGVAMFVFDKRGTGRSSGSYTQLFEVLSNDVVAATHFVRKMAGVDSTRIGLAGFSQGGWVAPLAALKDPGVRFVLIGYGMTMSVSDEDRLEAPLKLRERGFDDNDIREFNELNSAIHHVVDTHFAEGWDAVGAKMDQYRDRPWMKALPTMQTWAGSLAAMGLEQAKSTVPQMFKNFVDPYYQSVPTLQQLHIPILWLIAGDDIEAPPGPTIEALATLRKSGKDIQTKIFPHTDHGIVQFDLTGAHRQKTRYAPDYFPTMVNWILKQTTR